MMDTHPYLNILAAILLAVPSILAFTQGVRNGRAVAAASKRREKPNGIPIATIMDALHRCLIRSCFKSSHPANTEYFYVLTVTGQKMLADHPYCSA